MKSCFQIIIFSVFITNTHAYQNGDRFSLYDLSVEADVILDVSVRKVTQHVAKGSWKDENYAILHLIGSQITSQGTIPLQGDYLLRVPNFRKKSYANIGDENDRYIYFIKGNGSSQRPYLRNGVFIVSNNGNISLPGRAPIIGINKMGGLVYKTRFNQCTLDDAPEQEGAEYSSDGKLIRQYTREELLNYLNSFECPDGSRWWRGGDRPVGHVYPPPLDIDEFHEKIIRHLAANNIPVPSIDRGLRKPPNVTLDWTSELSGTEEADRALIGLLRDSPGFSESMPDRLIVDIYERQKLRKKEKAFPKKALERVSKIKRNTAKNQGDKRSDQE